MTKDTKVSFERVNEILQVSATWYKLGAGVYGVKCSKEATKAFSKSPRFAGRDGVTIDINKKQIVLTDKLPELTGFKGVTANSLKIALNGKNGEKEQAAFLGHAKKALEIWAGLTKKKPALHGVGLTTENGYQFFEELELAARVDGLQKIAFSFEGVHFLIEMTPAEFENEKATFSKLDQAFKIVKFRAILRSEKMSLPKYRRGAQLVDAGAVDVDKTEKFWRDAVKDIATRGAANAAGKCFFTKQNSKKIKAEFPAVAKEPRRVRAAFLVAILTKDESTQFMQAKKPAAKEEAEKPAEKAVKTAKKPAEKKPAAKTVKAAKKPAKPAEKDLKNFDPWIVDRAGHAWAKAGQNFAVITWGDGQDVKASMQDSNEGLKNGTLQTYKQVIALTRPPKSTVKVETFNRLYDWLYKHGMNQYQCLAAEYDKLSKNTRSDFYTAANAFQRERGDLLTSDREVIAYMMALRGIDPTKKTAKDTGFTVVTLDHKDLAASAETVKKKVVKALTNKPTKKAAKKSKSRVKLEQAQEDAQKIDTTAAEFVAFCAKINAGRQKPYSAKNCELIFSQTGGRATDVRGFKSWIKAGRAVKKGQKSIIIEAPRFIYDDKGQVVLDKHGRPKMYAVPCCVFDISQTEELKETKEA